MLAGTDRFLSDQRVRMTRQNIKARQCQKASVTHSNI